MERGSLEWFSGQEITENGLFIKSEVLENGLRVVTIEKSEEYESLDRPTELREGLPLDEGIEMLKDCLAAADGVLSAEVRDSIMDVSRSINASVRGVYETDEEIQNLLEDGIVYFSSSLRNSGDFSRQAKSIVEQIYRYAHPYDIRED